MFQRAVQADSSFALAYAMLSRGHESMYWEYVDRSEERCRLARRAASRALVLQPDLTEGHVARGYIFYHCEQDYERALEEFELALAENPNHADLFSAVAAVQRRLGKLEDAVNNFETSFSLDPRSHLKAFDIALTYGLMRRFDEADRYLDKALKLAPDVALPYVYDAWTHIFRSGDTATANEVLSNASGRADIGASQYFWWISRIVQPDYEQALSASHPGSDTAGYLLHRARLYRLLDRETDEYRCADSARSILERRLADRPDDPRFHSQLGLAYAGLRQKSEAIQHGRKALELLPYSRDAFDPLFFMVNLAEIFVIFEEDDAAIDQLEQLMSIPGFISGPYLQLDPLWKPLRSHPRFQRLLGSV
jgi:tetratricopeptide (TPR) repeat protein